MNYRVVLPLVLLALGFVGLTSIAPSARAALPQHTQPICACCPEVNLTFAAGCNCTIQIANELRRIGQCYLGSCLSGGQCGDPFKTCKLTGTVNEVGGGCTGTKSLNIVDACGGPTNSDTLACSSNGGTTFHTIELDCHPCTCPGTYDPDCP